MRLQHIITCTAAALTVGACTGSHNAATTASKATISVSLPVEAYFVERIANPDSITVNVLIPQSAGHSDYSPRPSQMASLAESEAYLAIGGLDFEQTWRERMCNANSKMKWVDLSQGIELIRNEHNDNDETGTHHHHSIDPHYWLSPKRAMAMTENMAKALNTSDSIRLNAIRAQIAQADSMLKNIAHGQSFMIYHPALTYLASDYGLNQIEIEIDGNAPTPQAYIGQLNKAKADSVRVIFVQQGYDKQKAQTAAESIGARIIEFNPESYDWQQTMSVIINALAE